MLLQEVITLVPWRQLQVGIMFCCFIFLLCLYDSLGFMVESLSVWKKFDWYSIYLHVILWDDIFWVVDVIRLVITVIVVVMVGLQFGGFWCSIKWFLNSVVGLSWKVPNVILPHVGCTSFFCAIYKDKIRNRMRFHKRIGNCRCLLILLFYNYIHRKRREAITMLKLVFELWQH